MTDIIWGWQLTLEIFLVGLGSAAIIMAFLIDLIRKNRISHEAMAAAYIAPVAIIAGVIVLVLHLAVIYRAPWNILNIIFAIIPKAIVQEIAAPIHPIGAADSTNLSPVIANIRKTTPRRSNSTIKVFLLFLSIRLLPFPLNFPYSYKTYYIKNR